LYKVHIGKERLNNLDVTFKVTIVPGLPPKVIIIDMSCPMCSRKAEFISFDSKLAVKCPLYDKKEQESCKQTWSRSDDIDANNDGELVEAEKVYIKRLEDLIASHIIKGNITFEHGARPIHPSGVRYPSTLSDGL